MVGKRKPPPRKVPMANINALTLYKHKLTAARRGQPIPQTKCLGKFCDQYEPEVVQCQNMGEDDFGDIQWRCDMDLPYNVELGQVHVSCEGWDGPGDTNVLAGSCGVEYHLNADHQSSFYGSQPGSIGSSMSLGSVLWFCLYGLVGLWVAYRIYCWLFRRPLRPVSSFWPFRPGPPGGGGGGGGHRPGWGGGGGGGGGGWWPGGFQPGPPPPPYSKYPSSSSSGASGEGQPTRGGFWTGLAAGAAGMWAANRLTQPRRDETAGRRDTGWTGGFGAQAGPSTGGAGPSRTTWGDMTPGPSGAPRRSTAERPGGDAGGSEVRTRRATGFGGSSTR